MEKAARRFQAEEFEGEVGGTRVDWPFTREDDERARRLETKSPVNGEEVWSWHWRGQELADRVDWTRVAVPFAREDDTRTLRLVSMRLPVIRERGVCWERQGQTLQVFIELDNPAATPTRCTHLVVEAAVLGAFAPFVPAAKVEVPPLEPGANRRLAVNVDLMAVPWSFRPYLPEGAKWAGNLNIWFDRAPDCAVELHRSLGLKVPAGKSTALGFFAPRDGSQYAYAFANSNASFRVDVRSVSCSNGLLVLAAPKMVGLRTEVEVAVTRRVDKRRVLVEFEFESVATEGDYVGCLPVG